MPYYLSETLWGKRFLKLLTTFLILFKPLDRKLASQYGENSKSKYQPVFIIGAPRTGSTILYQAITNFWDVAYINNFECNCNETILLAAVLSKKLLNYSHNCFESYHGVTPGLVSPSECGAIWYRWFPRDHHFVGSQELTDNQVSEMATTIRALTVIKDKPFIFKNMNCGQRLWVLAKAFPKALFLRITRHPLYTAQDILMVRERVFKNRETWWSVMPKEHAQLLNLPPSEQVVAQIFYLEKQIENDLEKLYPDRFLEVSYEELCLHHVETLENIRAFLKNHDVQVNLRYNYRLDFLVMDNNKYLDDETFTQLKQNVGKYFAVKENHV